MKKFIFIFFMISSIFCSVSYAQIKADSSKAQTKHNSNDKKKVKKGWNLGALPIISYNSDLGFQYGGLANLYDYGDGVIYPKYYHSIYMEISRTTKGGGINQIFYDSEHLLKKIRVTAVLNYFTEKALDFYGFNGYEAKYNHSWEDDSEENKRDSIYKSRVFYKHERKMFSFKADFQGQIIGKKFRWIAGLSHYNNYISTVDIDKLNKGEKAKDKLPDVKLLYDKYIDWGIISDKEKDGGYINFIKLGLIYDTRDNEPNPMKGIWTEVLINTAPSFLGNNDFAYTKLAVIHRQYFTLINKKLSFDYRLGYQGSISGKAPFFMQPYMISSFSQSTTNDGLGGAKTLRGILRNRVVGDGIVYGNFEFRWKFYSLVLFNQNVYLALNTFVDAGKVVKDIDFDKETTISIAKEEDKNFKTSDYFDTENDKIHISYGAGFHFAMNQNFVIGVDYGMAKDARDGKNGCYITIGYLF